MTLFKIPTIQMKADKPLIWGVGRHELSLNAGPDILRSRKREER